MLSTKRPTTCGRSKDRVSVHTSDGAYLATATQTVSVAAVPIFARSGGATGGEPLQVAVSFDDGNPTASYPVPGHTFSYAVDWGDGSAGTYDAPTFSHAYSYDYSTITPTNSYEYTVTASDGEYATSDHEGVSVLPPAAGSVDLNLSSSTAEEGQRVSLTASFSDSNQGTDPNAQGASGWSVWWGDGGGGGGEIAGPSALPSYADDSVYTRAGTYVVTVQAYYVEGDVDTGHYVSATQQVVVTPAAPTITATSDIPALVTGAEYSLSLSSTASLYGQGVNRWSVAWGDNTSTVYRESLPNPVTHIYTTASTTGTTYSPTVTAYTDEGSYSPTGTLSVIVAQPLMQVLQADGTPIDHDAQHTMGAFISVNDNDDGDNYDSNGNPLADDTQTSLSVADPDLVEVSLGALPSSVGGTYTLSWPGTADLDVYADPHKNQAVANGTTYDASAPHQVWVEGTGLSGHTGDLQNIIKASWSKLAGAAFVALADFATFNPISITGAKYVPANGAYIYELVGPVPAPDLDAWTVIGGIKTGEAADNIGIRTLWNQGAVFGEVGVVIGQSYVRLPVKVFAIQVSGGTFRPGTPAPAGTGPYRKESAPGASPFSVGVVSGNPGPGLAWTTTVTVAGPVKTGGSRPNNDGIKALRVGFIQNIPKTGFTNIGYYKPNNPGVPLMRASTANAQIQRAGPVLDGPSGAGPSNPWYFTPGTVAPWQPTINAPGTVLGDSDRPGAATPLDFAKDADQKVVAVSPNPLFRTDIEISFALYVCAETTEPANGANLVYAEEAEGDWKFNGSGRIGGPPIYPWTSMGAVVTPPGAWNAVVPGLVPRTSGIIGNVYTDSAKFK